MANTIPKIPFSRFCTTIGPLPTSYVQSLSYYEQIVFFVSYLNNEVVPAVNENGTIVNELYNYVHDYFDNLDVQQEINNKIDQLIQDGYFNELFKEFTDLINTKRDKNVLITLGDIDQQFKEALTGGAVAVVGEDSVDSINIRDDAVIRRKTNFMVQTRNLFDTDILNENFYVNSTNGELISNNSWYASDLVQVSPINSQMTFTLNGVYEEYYQMNVFFYNGEKTYLTWTSFNIVQNPVVTFDVPENTYYIRYAISKRTPPNEFTYQLEFGNSSTLYIPSHVLQTTDKSLPDKLITPAKTTFFEKTRNLFDPNYMTTGQLVNYLDGSLYLTPNWSLSNELILESNETNLTISIVQTDYNYYNFRMFYWDENKSYIGYTDLDVIQNKEKTYIIPEGAYFMRYAINIANTPLNKFTFQLEYNDHATDYVAPYALDYSLLINEPESLGTDSAYLNRSYILIGDSITALGETPRGWYTYFKEAMKPHSVVNVAVPGATVRDEPGTVWDGNPEQSNQTNNTLNNQVQKILNNNYDQPDAIIMYIGTNDTNVATDYNIEQSFTDSNNNTIPISEVSKTSFIGAYRIAIERLQEKYPEAQIFICSPTQGAPNTNRTVYSQTLTKHNLLSDLSMRISLPFINLVRCGIYSGYEVNGQEGVNTIDGLHPNINGAMKIGHYISKDVADWYKTSIVPPARFISNEDFKLDYTDFEYGSIQGTTGLNQESTVPRATIRTIKFEKFNKTIQFKNNDIFDVGVLTYTSDGSFVSSSGFQTEGYTLSYNPAYQYRILLRTKNQTAIDSIEQFISIVNNLIS